MTCCLLCRSLLLLLALLLLAPSSGAAQPSAEPVRVGLAVAPPFVDREADGDWVGFDIELWKMVAADAGWPYEFVEVSRDRRFDALAAGEVDVLIGSLSITAEREARVDFSTPYMNAGLQIYTLNEREIGTLQALLDPELRNLILQFLLYVGLLGAIFWWVERLPNDGIPQGPKGVLTAMYFTVTTATTVGYGDLTPRTGVGRVLSVLIMLTGIGFAGVVLGKTTSLLTLYSLEAQVSSPDALIGKPVATLADTTSEAYLNELGADVRTVDALEQAHELLVDGLVVAVVYDAPTLRYFELHNGDDRAATTGPIFERQRYGIALTESSPFREAVNQSLLRAEHDGRFSALFSSYFGDLERSRF